MPLELALLRPVALTVGRFGFVPRAHLAKTEEAWLLRSFTCSLGTLAYHPGFVLFHNGRRPTTASSHSLQQAHTSFRKPPKEPGSKDKAEQDQDQVDDFDEELIEVEQITASDALWIPVISGAFLVTLFLVR